MLIQENLSSLTEPVFQSSGAKLLLESAKFMCDYM